MLVSSPRLVTKLDSNPVLMVIGQLLKVASSTGSKGRDVAVV
jgi:hypothetical protein